MTAVHGPECSWIYQSMLYLVAFTQPAVTRQTSKHELGNSLETVTVTGVVASGSVGSFSNRSSPDAGEAAMIAKDIVINRQLLITGPSTAKVDCFIVCQRRRQKSESHRHSVSSRRSLIEKCSTEKRWSVADVDGDVAERSPAADIGQGSTHVAAHSLTLPRG
jgi:hypothetical protein